MNDRLIVPSETVIYCTERPKKNWQIKESTCIQKKVDLA